MKMLVPCSFCFFLKKETYPIRPVRCRRRIVRTGTRRRPGDRGGRPSASASLRWCAPRRAGLLHFWAGGRERPGRAASERGRCKRIRRQSITGRQKNRIKSTETAETALRAATTQGESNWNSSNKSALKKKQRYLENAAPK